MKDLQYSSAPVQRALKEAQNEAWYHAHSFDDVYQHMERAWDCKIVWKGNLNFRIAQKVLFESDEAYLAFMMRFGL